MKQMTKYVTYVWVLALLSGPGFTLAEEPGEMEGHGKMKGHEKMEGHDHVPGHGLGLSEEVVPYEELGSNVRERPQLITEAVDDALFAQNRERKKILESRASYDVTTEVPERKTLFGKGDRLLSPGATSEGMMLPTGAIWRPFWIFHGQYRTGLQLSEPAGDATTLEWANRLDLLADYYLSATERLRIGFRPLDEEGVFTGYTLEGDDEGGNDGFNFQPRTLFFEGELGEIFPRLDQNDRISLDYGFAVGRQPLTFQEGIMVADVLDGIGFSRNNMFLFGSSATRLAGFWAPHEVNRNDNLRDEDAQLFGIFTAHDFDVATIEVDAMYVAGGDRAGDGFYAGLGHIRRMGYFNSTFRANASWALDEESAAISDGILLTHELSRTMPYNEDLAYFNVFYGIDDYSSAARDASAGGPLAGLGLLYQAVGLGTFGSALGNRPNESVGFALGYQHFIDEGEKQLLFEFGGRSSTDSGVDNDTLGLGLRYQQALNRHMILVMDGYTTYSDRDEAGYGTRLELRTKF